MASGESKTSEKRSPLLDDSGRFKKGNPGGPGRPRGLTSMRKLLKEKLSKDEQNEILDAYMAKVRSGELLTDYLDRFYGKSKSFPEPVDITLPDVSTVEGAQSAIPMIAQAALDGEDKDQLSLALQAALKSLDVAELRQLVEAVRDLKKETGA